MKAVTDLKTFELTDAIKKIFDVSKKNDLKALQDALIQFDPDEYIAARIHSNKEWSKHTKVFGRNYIMAHENGVFAELRGKRISYGKLPKDKEVYANGVGFSIIRKSDINTIDTYSTVKKFVLADIPIFIEGFSGWGKSSIVNQVAKDLNLPIVTLSLASISPEDFGGIPRVQDETYFKYILPEWALRYKEPFILFLDEINQAPISVLHACYGLVLDRVLNGTKLPCKIVAAGNFLSENEYLTDLASIKPLMERFHKYTLNHDKVKALAYLEKKYELQLSTLLTCDWELTSLNPRRIEKYIKMVQAGITSTELGTDPDKPCEAAYYMLENIIRGNSLSALDAAEKANLAAANNDVEVDDGAETAIFNKLMEQATVS